MKVEIMKFLDRWVGIPLGMILSLGGVLEFLKKRRPAEINKVLVIRIWGAGDLIIALPAIGALRESFPKAQVVMLVTANIKDIIEGDPGLDRLIALDVSSIPRVVRSFSSALSQIRQEHFDLVVDLEQYSRTSALFAYLSGVGMRVGFDTIKQWRGFLFTNRVVFNTEQNVRECFLDLVSAVGIAPPDKKLGKLWVAAEDRASALALLKAEGVRDGDVVAGIHIGSSENALSKRWPKERFAELADRLVKERGIRPVFVGGPSETRDIEETIKLMDAEAINVAGKSTLKQLAAILERCQLFIGNDSAPMHIAAAMGTPTIGLYGPSSPLRFAPHGQEHIQLYRDVGCNPCNIPHLGKIPKCTEKRCLLAISVDDVMAAVDGHYKVRIQEMTPLGEK